MRIQLQSSSFLHPIKEKEREREIQEKGMAWNVMPKDVCSLAPIDSSFLSIQVYLELITHNLTWAISGYRFYRLIFVMEKTVGRRHGSWRRVRINHETCSRKLSQLKHTIHQQQQQNIPATIATSPAQKAPMDTNCSDLKASSLILLYHKKKKRKENNFVHIINY